MPVNLPSWGAQQQAIRNVASVLRPGGRFVFVEGLADGRLRLNALRERVGFEPMPVVWHNIDFAEATLLPFLDSLFTITERRHFGVYDFVARVVHPLTVAPAAPTYDARINEVAGRLALDRQDDGDLSRVIVLVLERR